MHDYISVEQSLTRLVEEMLTAREIRRSVRSSDSLIDAGLSSLDVVKLVFKVEAEFNLEIPTAELTPANFHSVSTILVLVYKLL